MKAIENSFLLIAIFSAIQMVLNSLHGDTPGWIVFFTWGIAFISSVGYISCGVIRDKEKKE